MNELRNANFIKALLIDFLIRKSERKKFLLGSEFLFGQKKRFTDLLLVDEIITSFEIKASNDDFRTIRTQLDDYKKVFDQLFLVVTENHLSKALNLIEEEEGLILVKNNFDIEILKEPTLISNQIKIEILETIPVKNLQLYFNLSKKLTANETRFSLQMIELDILKEVLIGFISNRLIPKNELFFSERGELTHFEDIKLLSLTSLKLL